MSKENAPYVIPHGRHSLVAGLHWELIAGARAAARRAARAREADRLTTVPAGRGQLLTGTGNLCDAGLTPKEARRAASLALCALPELGAHGWGIFPLGNDRYWFIAAQDGQLSVLSDVTGDREAVCQALETFLSFDTAAADDRILFCPDGLVPGVSGCERALEELLSGLTVSRTARLQPVSNRRALFAWSALLLLVFGGYFGHQQYQTFQDETKQAAARAAFLKAREQLKSATPAVLLPWKSQPVLQDFVSHCSRRWQAAPLSIAGWRFTTADCTQDAIRFAWSKPAGGTIGDFAHRLAHWYPGLAPLFNIPGSADTGGVAVALSMPLPASPEDAGSMEAQTQRLTHYAQQLRARLSLTEDGAATTRIDGQQLALPFRSFSFTFSTDIPPDRLFNPAQFDASGIRLTRITVSLAQARLHYVLEGTLYARR